MRELVGLLMLMVIVNLFQLLLYPYHLAPMAAGRKIGHRSLAVKRPENS